MQHGAVQGRGRPRDAKGGTPPRPAPEQSPLFLFPPALIRAAGDESDMDLQQGPIYHRSANKGLTSILSHDRYAFDGGTNVDPLSYCRHRVER